MLRVGGAALLVLPLISCSTRGSEDRSATVSTATTTATTPPISAGASHGGNDANERLEVGETGELSLFVHCGLRYARIDGGTWETTPRGGASAPDGWPDALTATATRIDRDTVVVATTPYVEGWIVFEPVERPHHDYACY